MSSLTGKTVLLTGATGGIGAEVAKQLSAEGALLILTGRSLEKLRALQRQLTAETLVYGCDLISEAEQQGLLQFLLSSNHLIGQLFILSQGLNKLQNLWHICHCRQA